MKLRFFVLIIAILLCMNNSMPVLIVSAFEDNGMNITGILNSILANGYDKRYRPNYGGAPVVVRVSLAISDISSISESQMDFTTKFYLRHHWMDNRLAFNSTTNLSELTVESEMLDKIWVPDTFFNNEKRASLHTVTKPNIFVKIKSNGLVYISTRFTMTASCPMNLRYFPMDSQICEISFNSYGHSIKSIIYAWNNTNPFTISNEIELPQFRIVGQRISTLRSGYGYSGLKCEILFQRSIGYYLIQVYIPAILIVTISWIPFCLNGRDSYARVALGVTTLLTITTLITSTNESLPKISYIKSIDVFLEACFLMVFAALLEYASVGYLLKLITFRNSRKEELFTRKFSSKSIMGFHPTYDSSLAEMIVTQTVHKPLISSENITGMKPESKSIFNFIPKNEIQEKIFGFSPSDVDKYSSLAFPICFICFNLFYWIYYLNVSDIPTNNFVLSKSSDL